MKSAGLLIVMVALAAALRACAAEEKPPGSPEQADVFVAGQDGYHTYRIPALLVTPKGTVLAFAEGRKRGRGDSGDIDTVLRRSTDGGATWGPLQIVADDGPNTFGNPCPVADRATGTLWLPLTHNLGEDNEAGIRSRTAKGTRTVWMTRSTDDGATWAKPVEITATAKADDWTWYATGPGCGIQLASGRLVIPCDHNLAETREQRSHVIYSDDGGKTWARGGTVGGKVNECQVVELGDGTLLLNMRSYAGRGCRAVATSRDGGLSWTAAADDPVLVEPVCQAALIRLVRPGGAGGALLAFSNPASRKREKMTVRLSADEGRSWPAAALLWAGPAAYSALAALPDGRLACLYERGEKSAYERIVLARFTVDWALAQRPAPEAAR